MAKVRPIIRLLVQALVSAAILAVLVIAARQGNVFASLQELAPAAVGSAFGLMLAACVINSLRWQLLLRRLDVHERLRTLTALYLIGQFFSLFLPTSAGGDAVRIFQVARRRGRPGHVLLATLQERLLGLGVTLLIGLAATFYYWASLPPALRLWGAFIQIAGLGGVAMLLYPAPLLSVARWIWKTQRHRPALERLAARPLGERLRRALRSLGEMPPIKVRQLLPLLALATVGVLLGIDTCHILAQALGIDAGFLTFCLVIPLVWMVRMLPVSLNGIGVGEGAFVFLMGLFAVATDKALALALALLGLQTMLALAGGLLLVCCMLFGTWRSVPAQPNNVAPLPHPTLHLADCGEEVTGNAA